MMALATTIDEYIDGLSVDVQPLMQAVRSTIRAAAPEATEKISYRMPTFWQGENLIHFAAFKRHIGVYPGGEAVGIFADRLTGYKTSKGTIQFPLDKPIDHALIADITRWRVEQLATTSAITTLNLGKTMEKKLRSVGINSADALTAGLSKNTLSKLVSDS